MNRYLLTYNSGVELTNQNLSIRNLTPNLTRKVILKAKLIIIDYEN